MFTRRVSMEVESEKSVMFYAEIRTDVSTIPHNGLDAAGWPGYFDLAQPDSEPSLAGCLGIAEG